MAGTKTSQRDNTIGDLLVRDGLLSPDDLKVASSKMRESARSLMRVLIEDGMIDETKRLNFLRHHFGVPLVTLKEHKLDTMLLNYIPSHLCRRNRLLPVRLEKDGLIVVMEDPSDLVLLDELKEIAGVRIKPVLAFSEELTAILNALPDSRIDDSGTFIAATGPRKFDPIARLFGYVFMPVTSIAVLGGIFLLLAYYEPFQVWLKTILGSQDAVNRTNQIWTLFLYFFLSWGVWTLLMFEINGLVFADHEWKDKEDVGEPRRGGRALLFSIFLGLFGVDRFYLGYTRMGVLKLLTVGLCGIWWLLDIVALFLKAVPDAAGRDLV